MADSPALPASAGGQEAAPDGWQAAFLALRNRDFRLFLTGQVISVSGTWMQSLALSWLVYRLTGSTVIMGVIGFCSHFPILALSPIGGLIADHYPRRTVVLIAQSAQMLQAFALAALTLSGHVNIPAIALLAFVGGTMSAFEIPARQALFVHLVGKDALLSAISLNSVTFNAARIFGPALGGFLVAATGEGMCFLLNAVSFLPVLWTLARMTAAEPPRTASDSPWDRLRGGFSYARNHPRVRVILILNALINFSVAPVMLLGPVFADSIFGKGSQGLGLLTGALGLGAVAGTLSLARHGTATALPSVVSISLVTITASLTFYGLSPVFNLSLAVMFTLGFGLFRQLASLNTLVQTSIEDDYRGRVMSLYSMTVVGMTPIANLAAGAIASPLGVRSTVLLGAVISLSGAALWWRHRRSTS